MKKITLLALLLTLAILLTACTGKGGDTSGKNDGVQTDESDSSALVQDNAVDGSIWFGEDDADDKADTSTTTKKGATTTTKKGATTTTVKTTKKTAVSTAKPTKDGRITLPGKGTDLDGKGRILVSAVSASGRKVTITLKNVSSTKNGGEYITEETMEVYYKCYNKNGKELTSKDEDFGVLYPGCLEVGDTKELNFTVPTGTAKVVITGAKIVYWTPWS